jgi:hypothetical protein
MTQNQTTGVPMHLSRLKSVFAVVTLFGLAPIPPQAIGAEASGFSPQDHALLQHNKEGRYCLGYGHQLRAIETLLDKAPQDQTVLNLAAITLDALAAGLSQTALNQIEQTERLTVTKGTGYSDAPGEEARNARADFLENYRHLLSELFENCTTPVTKTLFSAPNTTPVILSSPSVVSNEPKPEAPPLTGIDAYMAKLAEDDKVTCYTQLHLGLAYLSGMKKIPHSGTTTIINATTAWMEPQYRALKQAIELSATAAGVKPEDVFARLANQAGKPITAATGGQTVRLFATTYTKIEGCKPD